MQTLKDRILGTITAILLLALLVWMTTINVVLPFALAEWIAIGVGVLLGGGGILLTYRARAAPAVTSRNDPQLQRSLIIVAVASPILMTVINAVLTAAQTYLVMLALGTGIIILFGYLPIHIWFVRQYD